MMKSLNNVSTRSESMSRICLLVLFITASLGFGAYFICSTVTGNAYQNRLATLEVLDAIQGEQSTECQNRRMPRGTEVLPRGILVETSNFEMKPLWSSSTMSKPESSKNLLAVAVGCKQKELVDRIVRKFLSSDFSVILFHYDGVVDEWIDFPWTTRVVHVSAINQTKWWFAKRFMHPDIVDEYDYIFIWDEDLGVDNFDPQRYLSIVKEEGLEVSQPALDPAKSEIHHQITGRYSKSRVHRRMIKTKGSGRCDQNSTSPPCIGWVEMMAPVFSRSAWRCSWYMIQNDLIHAWGLDMKLGYCAGDRMKNVGVVDTEYIVHLGLPTLGSSKQHMVNDQTQTPSSEGNPKSSEASAPSASQQPNGRLEVRKQSYHEMQIFRTRWDQAVKEDKCYIDPYPSNQTNR